MPLSVKNQKNQRGRKGCEFEINSRCICRNMHRNDCNSRNCNNRNLKPWPAPEANIVSVISINCFSQVTGMAFFGRVGNILKHATNKKISSELCSFPSVFQTIRCFSNPPSTKLFVGGVSYGIDEQNFREMFSKYGQVVDARIVTDRETGRSKGFGFITYSTVDEASSAIQALDGQDVQGRRIGVNFAIERPRGFGGGGGGFDGSYGNTSYGAGAGTRYTSGYGNSPYGAASSAGAGGYGGYGGNVAGGNPGGYGNSSYGAAASAGAGRYGGNVAGGNPSGYRNSSYGSASGVGGYGDAGGNVPRGNGSGGYGGRGYESGSTAAAAAAAAGGGGGYGSRGSNSGDSFTGGYDRSGGLGYGSSGQLDSNQNSNVGDDYGDYGAFAKRA